MSIDQAIATANALLPGVAAAEGEVDPRWQAIIAIADYVESCPEEVWPFVARWGSHPDSDLRDAIATVLLEHLLEHHFELLFQRVETLADSEPLFGDTVTRCWKFGQTGLPRNSGRFDGLVDRLRR